MENYSSLRETLPRCLRDHNVTFRGGHGVEEATASLREWLFCTLLPRLQCEAIAVM